MNRPSFGSETESEAPPRVEARVSSFSAELGNPSSDFSGATSAIAILLVTVAR